MFVSDPGLASGLTNHTFPTFPTRSVRCSLRVMYNTLAALVLRGSCPGRRRRLHHLRPHSSRAMLWRVVSVDLVGRSDHSTG